jgi:hypothetical protein
MRQPAPRYEWSPEVLFRSSGPDVLLAPPGRDDFELLSGTAGVLWRLLQTPVTIDAVVDELADLYQADRDAVAADVGPVLDDLTRRGLVRQAPEADA